MASEKQYIELYQQAREVIFSHAPETMNAVRDQAFEDFRQQGFPSKKVERVSADGSGSHHSQARRACPCPYICIAPPYG